ncbi:PadR family transcriptional regulator [Actinomadura logoneensis]|uniref:PadR family transcriptional regulator n=1 Tax=Actinomadura logoneensis TaxID=2293572 RepID=A0A372JCS9_9ACTN|nr:PadR family transcriptional regulator [Actinomadura logoneensis]RFU37821.1 PadR family transcriptional regulator [Actinomadura logoneensis]
MAKRRKVANLLALPVLSALAERPMYPYEIASTLRRRGKDAAVKINWGSLYTVVRNLEKHGMIKATGTVRQGNQPDRTVYAITPEGRAELNDWLRELVAVPEREYPRFEAALSDVAVLHPREFTALLRRRLEALEAELAEQDRQLAGLRAWLPELLIIEADYHRTLSAAEVGWVRTLLARLEDGSMPGLDAWARFHETGEVPQEIDWLREQERRDTAEQAEHPAYPEHPERPAPETDRTGKSGRAQRPPRDGRDSASRHEEAD